MNDADILILGIKYKVLIGNKKKYPQLDGCDGYTDTTIKTIVIDNMLDAEEMPDSKQNLKEYQKQVMRHEVLHAFLFESGLDSNTFSFNAWATNEEIVDWFAIQYPKIKKVYNELGIE